MTEAPIALRKGATSQPNQRREKRRARKRISRREEPPRRVIGWREWIALPDLGIPAIKAKIDTGARTSALHAFNVQPFWTNGHEWVGFDAHPLQGNDRVVVTSLAKVKDRRRVTNPGGRREMRYIVETMLRVGETEWPVELSLTNRDDMGFRMLIGREAMRRQLVVDPALSYRCRRLKTTDALSLYGGDRVRIEDEEE